MWQSVAPWLAQGGALGVVSWVFYRLHRDAIAAEQRRADDWRAAAEATQARADVREEQLGIMLGRAPAKEPMP